MKIIAKKTGTKTGYEDYHGEFILNNKIICTWSYDKKQNKYITDHIHKSYNKGYKFLYARSIEGLRIQIENRIKKFE